MESDNKVEEPKKIQVITGDGNLNISPVYTHIEIEKPKQKDSRNVIIPKVKDNINKKQTNSDD